MDTSSDIEVRELGFTLLSDPVQPGAEWVLLLGSESDLWLTRPRSVFFVHGLQGHPRNTWAYSVKGSRVDRSPSRRQALRNRFNQAFRSRSGNELEVYQNRNDQVFWPHDLLCESFPTLRVFTYGYDSHVTHWFNGPAMQLDILSHGESLLSGIAARRIDDPKRPLILVVHSLGGLLIKDVRSKVEVKLTVTNFHIQVLRRARGSTDPRYKNIYSAVSGIIFFGTPHHGGNYINMGLTARKIVAASGLDTSDKLLRDLKFDSTIAKMLSEEFTQFLHEREPLVYTFQEASGLSGFGPLSGKVRSHLHFSPLN